MEYMDLGDLHDYLLDRPALPESQVQDISYQILEGLQMMHENEFIHRDLKPLGSLWNKRNHQARPYIKCSRRNLYSNRSASSHPLLYR